MGKKKQLNILLVLLLICSLLTPFNVSSADTVNKDTNYKLYKLTDKEELNNGVILEEGFIFWGKSTKGAALLQFGQQEVEINKSNLVELPEENYSLDKFKFTKFEIDDVETHSIEKNTRLYSGYTEEPLVIVNRAIDYIIKENKVIIGFLPYSLDEEIINENESNTETSDEVVIDENTKESNDETVEDKNLIEENNNEQNTHLLEDDHSEKYDGQDKKVIDDSNKSKESEVGNINEDENRNIVTDSNINEDKTREITSIQVSSNSSKFTSSDRYMKVNANVSVYKRGNDGLIEVGRLKAGQVYPRYEASPNWHEIQYGNARAFVRKDYTEPASGTGLENKNDKYNVTKLNEYFTTKKDVVVYDNSNGSPLVPFGTLESGEKYPIAYDYGGNWIGIVFGDRIGYIRTEEVRKEFASSDRYMKVNANVSVYKRGNDGLIEVGRLKAGQVYPRYEASPNWHEIQYGNARAFVRKDYTEPASGTGLENKNDKYSVTKLNEYFTTKKDVVVYDNSNGSPLVPFGTLESGEKYPIAYDYGGNWIGIVFGDRIGYIRTEEVRKEFASSDRYMKVNANVSVYKRGNDGLIEVGRLKAGQVYPRYEASPNWHEIQYGNARAFVRKDYTEPASGSKLKNLNTDFDVKKLTEKLITNQDVVVYDNSNGSPLVPFGTIESGQTYPIADDYGGNWIGIVFGGRFGYVKTEEVKILLDENSKKYDITLDQMIDKQMGLSAKPQTDAYRNSPIWVSGNDVVVKSGKARIRGKITGTGVNVRNEPNTNSGKTTLAKNTRFEYVRTVSGQYVLGSSYWYEIIYKNQKKYVHSSLASISIPYYESASSNSHIYGSISFSQGVNTVKSSGGWYQLQMSITWRNAKRSLVQQYVDPTQQDDYQFLVLSKSVNTTASKLNQLLKNKGILHGKGSSYIKAGAKYGVNEIYLISHSLLETGNGGSSLARGVKVGLNSQGKPTLVNSSNQDKLTKIKTVYNMYGIGANDGCALSCGAIYAYNNSWTTPDTAIIEGAQFVSKNYISKGQDTLYKMRWNPDNPGTHQYATDVGWAAKQVYRLKEYYKQINAVPVIEKPVYKR